MKELKDLVVGDDVLVTGMYYRRIAKVDKVTKTQIVVDNARYRRNSGWQCGDDIWDRKSISVPTEKEISDVKEENFRKKLIYAIRSFDFKRLSTDELKQVCCLVHFCCKFACKVTHFSINIERNKEKVVSLQTFCSI